MTQDSKTCLILEKLGEALIFHFFFLGRNTECNGFVKRNTNYKTNLSLNPKVIGGISAVQTYREWMKKTQPMIQREENEPRRENPRIEIGEA